MKLLISLSIAVLILSSSSLDARESSFSYKVVITNKGTRSEGRIGRLYYKGKLIRYNFDEIITPIGTYTFFRSSTPWGFRGYKKTSSLANTDIMPVRKVGALMLDKIKRSGFYNGRVKIFFLPNRWLLVKRMNKFYWVDPLRLEEFIRIKGFRSRSPFLGLQGLKP